MEWLLPNVVLPGTGLVLAAAAAIEAAKQHGFGVHIEILESLAKDPKTRDVAVPLSYAFAGYVFSNWLAFAAERRLLDFFMLDETTALFLQALVKWVSLALVLSLVARSMGYTTTGLDTMLASSGVAVAFASQTMLRNFVAGMILLVSRPFKVGDRIQVGKVQGTVVKIGILDTQVLADCGSRVVYSNQQIDESYLENLTAHGMRRVEVPVVVTVDNDVAGTRAALEEAIEPFQELWHAQEPPAPPKRPAPHSNTTPGFMAKLNKVMRRLDANGDGRVSAHELLSALSGRTLAERVVPLKAKVAEAQRGYVFCNGGTDLGIQWFVHVWVPTEQHPTVFVEVAESIFATLQQRGIKIATRAV